MKKCLYVESVSGMDALTENRPYIGRSLSRYITDHLLRTREVRVFAHEMPEKRINIDLPQE